MSKRGMLRAGTIALKIALSIVLFVVAAGVAGKLGKGITGRPYSPVSLAYIFEISMIVPIWYRSSIVHRFTAAFAGIVAGLGAWMISFFTITDDIALSSQNIALVRTGAIIVALVVCVAVLRHGRSTRKSDPAPA